jgi:hypothetical protein
MNLYQTTELARLEQYVDDDGVIDIESFNNAQITLQHKQLAVVAYLKNESVRIDMLDNAIKELQARKKAMQSAHEGLKNYLLINMQENGISEISAQDMTFSAKIKKNPPKLIIDDAGLIPGELYVYPEPPAPYPDNELIKAKLKAGEVIEGAHLEQGIRVDIK